MEDINKNIELDFVIDRLTNSIRNTITGDNMIIWDLLRNQKV